MTVCTQCGQICRRSPCGTCRRSNPARNQRADPYYQTAEWRVLRAETLARDPYCRRCAAAPSTEADHRVPRQSGGADDLSNTQGLCKACHSAKTLEEQRSTPRASVLERIGLGDEELRDDDEPVAH